MSTPIDPAGKPCPRCGTTHLPGRCTGHVTKDGQLRACRKWRVKNMAVCATHGGSTPQAIVAAERRRAMAEAEQVLGRIGPIPVLPMRDVYVKLREHAGRIEGWMTVLGARVERMTELGDAEGRLHPNVRTFETAMRLLADLLVAIGRLDLEERIARIDRADAQAIADFVDQAMDLAGLSPADQQRVREAFAELVRRMPREGEL